MIIVDTLKEKSMGGWRSRVQKRTRASSGMVFPAVGITLIILIALLAPWLSPSDPLHMDIMHRLAEPSLAHPLGQDEFGRDVLSRLLYGARTSLSVAFISVSVSLFIGTLLGAIAGYYGGFYEILTLRTTEIVLAFPPILLALLVVTFFGQGMRPLIVVLVALYVPGFARVTYGEVLALRHKEYVEAARALGATTTRILVRTIGPNVLPALLVQYSLTMSSVVLLESGLSFLGLGITPPAPSWGLMVRAARTFMTVNPLGLVWPCLALMLTVLAINRFCDALRDRMDPRGALHPRSKKAEVSRSEAKGAQQSTASMKSANVSTALSAKNMTVEFERLGDTALKVVDGASFDIRSGETVALVGESGSGKSVSALALMRLLPAQARISGQADFAQADGQVTDLICAVDRTMRSLRGDQMSMVFQEPMTSLNPVYRIGDQVVEQIVRHHAVSRREARDRAMTVLKQVGVSDVERRFFQYPHQLSGGMRQRVMIAMALSCDPRLVIADEPTTALDVTIQSEILAMLRERSGKDGLGMLFVTHNLGVVAQLAQRVIVMYAGRIVETGTVQAIFEKPRHPYTKSLLACLPNPAGAVGNPRGRRLQSIEGTVPALSALPGGCTFAPRCSFAIAACREKVPELAEVSEDHMSRCIRWSAL